MFSISGICRSLGKKWACVGAVALGCALFATNANAAIISSSTTLDKLLDGVGSDQILLGDKLYSNFTYDNTGKQIPASQIAVTVSTADGTNYSIRFNFASITYSGQFSDITIGYRLDVYQSSDVITKVGLVFNGTVPVPTAGNASASVSELVRTVDGSDLSPGAPISDTGILSVYNDGASSGLTDKNSDFLVVNPTQSLFFVKNILVDSEIGGGTVHLSYVDNLVEQTPVPEPTSIAAMSVASLLLMRRRK